MPPKKISRSGPTKKTSRGPVKPVEDDAHGILEGISSLHSWIKTQTMIRPAKLGVKREGSVGFSDEEDEDIVISLTSKDPNVSSSQVRLVSS